ncbi:MAG: hypothetical protein PQJ49_04355 [Sphaerochaetaceae bacterium]|nr:hypothetical protein [Sphaerochaetaceae bacterium]
METLYFESIDELLEYSKERLKARITFDYKKTSVNNARLHRLNKGHLHNILRILKEKDEVYNTYPMYWYMLRKELEFRTIIKQLNLPIKTNIL